MAFSLLNYKLAVDYWDISTNKDEDKEKYEYAKMQLKGFPDNIAVLFSSKDYPKIISEYKEYTGPLSDDALLMVIQALFLENQHREAFNEIALKIHSAAQFEKIILSCSPCLNKKEKEVLSICRSVSSIFDESWNRNLKLLGDVKNGSINPVFVAIALARTEGLPAKGSTIQKPFSDFLEKEFIKKFEAVPDSLVFDIGTAVEKAGRRIDILKYYEMAARRFTENPDNERICAERWILAKENQAQYSGSKGRPGRAQEAAEKRKEYGIEGKIDDFITLDEKSSVIRYIINCEMDKELDKIKPSKAKATVKIPRRKPDLIDQDGVKQKVELVIENYRLAYFTKSKKLNIESNTDGKTISLYNSEQKKDCFSTQDYVITNVFTNEIGDCQKIKDTPIHFCIMNKKITVYFENTNVVINFL
jgi:hypothetical protein